MRKKIKDAEETKIDLFLKTTNKNTKRITQKIDTKNILIRKYEILIWLTWTDLARQTCVEIRCLRELCNVEMEIEEKLNEVTQKFL